MKDLEITQGSSKATDENREFEQNDRFNEMLDEGDLGEYSLTLRRPDGIETPIPTISRALFFADRPTYAELLNQRSALERREILRLDEFPENEAVFERL